MRKIWKTTVAGVGPFVVEDENDIICTVKTEQEAHLIAAAPELLLAVKRAEMWIGKMIADGAHLNSVAPGQCVTTLRMIEAAIAKSEGRK